MSVPERGRTWPALAAVALSAAPLWLHLPFWLVALAFALLLGKAVLVWRGRAPPAFWWLLPPLLLAAWLCWRTLGTLVGREGGVGILLLLLGFKAQECAQQRDWRVLIALGVFLAAMPLLFDQSPAAAVWLALSLLALTGAMAALEGAPWRGSLRSAASALALALPLMLVLFVVMPRLSGPLWSMPSEPGRQAVSGLGDSLEPGSVSQLILSREPAFSVVFPQRSPPRAQMYWRVLLLDRFDGSRWSGGETRGAAAEGVSGGDTVEYAITLEPDKGRLPALDVPQLGEDASRLRYGMVLRGDGKDRRTQRFYAVSRLGASYRAALSDAERAFYLRLPPGNPRARAWARELAARGEGAFAQAALQAFQSQGFRYTLNPPLLDRQDEIDQFLFSSRQGFCEHYASALAFLARAAGMPARIVVGYQGGEYNPVGRFWQVKSSDAHAWVEIWLAESRQWLRVDPTGAVAPLRLADGAEQSVPALRERGVAGLPPAWLRDLRQNWQAAGFAWQQWVVGYDAARQRNVFQRLGLGESVSAASVLRALLVGVLLAALPLAWWWRRGRGREEPLTRGWRLLLAELRRRRIEAGPCDGPLELLRRAKPGLAEAEYRQLKALVQDYVALRYRAREVDAARQRDWLRRSRRFRLARK
ncbi:hypothetical protein VK98_19845 [Chromobacterium sp. LK11]|uniref:transglutaminase family protein n=1 Tax=Chromobacterium sp. LK11 TaxID=1628212 RepID=UPI000653B984|nr:DUF3488 and transglutaminase-like domain-containing protein [Chromobacterium sp. LK11]KMN76810.1 hypothetical protein VK98_19845 [Chromobacterium sp. LK11]